MTGLRTYTTTTGEQMPLPIAAEPARVDPIAGLEMCIRHEDRRLDQLQADIDRLRVERAAVAARRRQYAHDLRALRNREAAKALNLERH